MHCHSARFSATLISLALCVVFSSVLAFNLLGPREREEWGETDVN